MFKKLLMIVLAAVFVCAIAESGNGASPAPEREKSKPAKAAPISKEDQAALELGRKVLAVRKAIQNPKAPNAMKAVTDLGLDQRNYVMVRGWLSYQLQGNMSILDTTKDRTPDKVKERISFLKKAIRAIDLE
jgi:hypothetical protein